MFNAKLHLVWGHFQLGNPAMPFLSKFIQDNFFINKNIFLRIWKIIPYNSFAIVALYALLEYFL